MPVTPDASDDRSGEVAAIRSGGRRRDAALLATVISSKVRVSARASVPSGAWRRLQLVHWLRHSCSQVHGPKGT